MLKEKTIPPMKQEIIEELKRHMNDGIKALERRLSSLRTGRASPSLLETIPVEVYGSRMVLSQLANLSAPEPRMLMAHVWDATIVPLVDKAIRAFGLNPIVEGSVLRIPLPEPSQERRQELVKLSKEYGEEARVGLRILRRTALEKSAKEDLSEDALHGIKKDIQKTTDDFISLIDTKIQEKEKEILKI